MTEPDPKEERVIPGWYFELQRKVLSAAMREWFSEPRRLAYRRDGEPTTHCDVCGASPFERDGWGGALVLSVDGSQHCRECYGKLAHPLYDVGL